MFIRFVAVLGLIAVGLTPGASADDLRSAATKVSDCRSIEDDAARLTCLDAAALALSLALDADAVVAPAPAPAPVAEAPKEPKWARAPKPKKEKAKQAAVAAPAPVDEAIPEKERNVPIWARVFGPGDEEEVIDVYEVTVTRITRNNLGRHFFYTSEGQVWRQTVVEPVKAPKSLPADVVIENKMMGAPSLKFVDGPRGGYRVRRVE